MANPILTNGVGSPQSIYTSSSTQTHMLGTRGILPDGRAFRYAKAGAVDLAPGKITVAPTIVANHQNLATTTTALVAGHSTATGITLGATLATADQYAEGFLAVTDAGGEGHLYKVKNHDAIDSAGTGSFDLYDEIAVASDASTTVSLFYNNYDNVVISVADQADVATGIPQGTITAAEFGWIQTWGPSTGLCDEITAVGNVLTIGSSVVGALEVQDLIAEQSVGIALSVGVDTEYQMVDLRIAP